MTYFDKLERIKEVTEWLERETAQAVLNELRQIIRLITKNRVVSGDIQRFMKRLNERK